jgi:hypothetical protein
MRGKYFVNIATGCWEWLGSRSSRGKYPTISVEGSRRPEYAYKVAWESLFGPVPETPCLDGSWRWELHHICLNRNCVNPNHLQLVTQRAHMAIHSSIRRGKAA